jgi:Uma2 family endonuclease
MSLILKKITLMASDDRILLEMPDGVMSEDQFVEFCRKNERYQIEREANGLIVVMEPSGFETDSTQSELVIDLGIWNRRHQLGRVAGSSAGYTLPNRAVRAPDASWISHNRLRYTTPQDREQFVHAVPEFVAEVRSPSDRLPILREKMREYIANGVLLGWLIDRKGQTVEIYRADGSTELLEGFDRILSGEDVLPGFEFELRRMK